MGRNTSIEWTDHTWPVVAGCKEVSPGCAHCYAARLNATRLRSTDKYRGLAVIGANGHPHFTGEARLWAPHLDWPLTWKKGARVFVADMSDLFYEQITNEEIAAVFGVMAACPQHTFQVLTKRAERMAKWFEWAAAAAHGPRSRCFESAADLLAKDSHPRYGVPEFPERLIPSDETWPLPNVWLGVSVEDQPRADERIVHLTTAPAAVRFLSCEPLVGPVDISAFLRPRRRVDLVILGGESGARARPCPVERVRFLMHQAQAAGCRVFVKQLGSNATLNGVELPLKHPRGGDPREWPEDVRVRELPT